MTSQLSIPAVVLGAQGALNAAVGIYGLVRPAEWILQTQNKFGGSIPGPVGYSLSLQLLGMGIFTAFAASQQRLHRRGLMARLGLHVVAAYLFSKEGQNLRDLALADAGFAVLNAVTIFLLGDGRVP